MRFEWDDDKDQLNQRKHGLSFSQAKKLFDADRDYLEIFDAPHSNDEDRFIAIGEIDHGIAVVVYTEREDHAIRIIGARLATNREQERFRVYMDKHT